MGRKYAVDIGGVLAANPEFAEAYHRGDRWARDYVSKAHRLNDGDAYAFERNFDSKPRNWCGNCPEPEGCVKCTLPPPRTRADVVKLFDDSLHPKRNRRR